MSLESGLSKLAGLKALQELNLAPMATRIGVKEFPQIVHDKEVAE
jgi:hypothetical protein